MPFKNTIGSGFAILCGDDVSKQIRCSPDRVWQKEGSVKRSSSLKRYVSLVGLLLTISLSVVYLAGCSSNSTAPEELIPSDPQANWFDVATNGNDAAKGPKIEIEGDLDVLPVGIAGGELSFSVEGIAVELDVPAGAVSTDVEITVDATRIKTVLGPIYLFDFGPDGLVFDKPLQLHQPMPAGQRFAYLYYYNPETKAWELQQSVRVVNGVAVFNIYHFSKYGVS